MTDGYQLLGLIELGELQNLGFGERRHGKAGALGRGQEGIHDLRVLFIKDRAGGIDKLTAGSHARGGFLEHRQLQFGQLNRHILFGQAPRNLGMTTHGSGARARCIDKDRVELNRLAKHGIKRCEHLIKLARITRNRTNALNTGLMQASEIQIALAIMKIERRMLTLISRTLGLAHHHIGLGATTGTNLKAASRTRGSCGDKLRVEIRRHGRSALKHARCNRDLRIDRGMAAREHRRDELRDIRIGLGRKGVLMQGQRRGGQIAGKVKCTLWRVERCHNASAQPTRQTHQARQTNQASLRLIHIGRSGKVLNIVRDFMQHSIGQASGGLSTAAHQLNTLTYGNAARRMQIEHLEGRDTERHANTRRNLFRLIEKLIEKLVQNTLRGGDTQRQASGKSGIALVNGLSGSTGGQHVACVHAAAIGLHQHIERKLARGRQLVHDSTPHLSSAPCRPAAQADAAMARLPSGLTSSSSTAPSERPR